MTRLFLCRHRRSVRHQVLSPSLDNHAIGLRLAMDVEVEGGALVGIAQIEIAACKRDLVALGDAGGDDLARRSHNAAAADLVDAFLNARLGDANDKAAVLVGAGLHHELVVEERKVVVFWRGRIMPRGVVADQHHLDALKSHDPVRFAPAAIVANGHADHAAEGVDHAESRTWLEVTFLQMLKGSPWLVFGMSRQMNLAVFGNDRAAPVHQNGRVVTMGHTVLDGEFGIAEIKADSKLAREVEQRLGFSSRHFAFEIAIDLRLIFHVPAREERGQCEFGIDNQIAALRVRLAHQRRQTRHHGTPRLVFRDRTELADRDVHKSSHGVSSLSLNWRKPARQPRALLYLSLTR